MTTYTLEQLHKLRRARLDKPGYSANVAAIDAAIAWMEQSEQDPAPSIIKPGEGE